MKFHNMIVFLNQSEMLGKEKVAASKSAEAFLFLVYKSELNNNLLTEFYL